MEICHRLFQAPDLRATSSTVPTALAPNRAFWNSGRLRTMRTTSALLSFPTFLPHFPSPHSIDTLLRGMMTESPTHLMYPLSRAEKVWLHQRSDEFRWQALAFHPQGNALRTQCLRSRSTDPLSNAWKGLTDQRFRTAPMCLPAISAERRKGRMSISCRPGPEPP
jgi:hypothetical protein